MSTSDLDRTTGVVCERIRHHVAELQAFAKACKTDLVGLEGQPLDDQALLDSLTNAQTAARNATEALFELRGRFAGFFAAMGEHMD